MNLLFKFVITITLLIISTHSFAQKNYVPAELILKNGQALNGFIDYQEWSRNPKAINFKRSQDAEKETYNANELKEFHVKNEVYVGAIIKNETGRNELDGLTTDPKMYLHDDTVFLMKLIDGTKSLYSYINHRGVESFYIFNHDQFELLQFKKFIEFSEDSINIVHKQYFVVQLIEYLDDCLLINDYIKLKTDYDRPTLTKIFDQYYECTKDKVTYRKKKDQTKYQFGLLAGASLSSVKLKSKVLDDYEGATFNQSNKLALGVNFNIILSRNLGKWSINNDILFTSYNTHGEYNKTYHASYYTNSSFNFKTSYIQLSNMLRRSFLYKNGSIFLELGIANGYALSSSNDRYSKTVSYTNVTTSTGEAIKETRKYEQSYLAGIGTTYKKFMLECRYQRGNGMSNYSNISCFSRRTFFLVGYRF